MEHEQKYNNLSYYNNKFMKHLSELYFIHSLLLLLIILLLLL